MVVFVHGNTVACFGKSSETVWETWVAERLASRRTAEVAQQVARTRPAGARVEEIGRLEMFRKWRLERSSQQHAFVSVESHCSKTLWRARQTATRLLQRVEVNLEDPIIADNTKMTGAERRLSEQLYCVLALTCRKRALQIVQQVPRGYVFEAWRQQCQKFEPHPPVRSSGMLQVLLLSTKSAELKRLVRGKTEERSARTSRATRCLTGSQQDRRRGIVLVVKQPSFSEQDRRVRCLETQTWCCWAVEKVTSQQNRRSTSAGRNLATARVSTGTSPL